MNNLPTFNAIKVFVIHYCLPTILLRRNSEYTIILINIAKHGPDVNIKLDAEPTEWKMFFTSIFITYRWSSSNLRDQVGVVDR